MRRRLNESLSYFQQTQKIPALEECYLVGRNLFLFVTARGWSYLNSLEEVLFLQKFGYRQPLEVPRHLVGKLGSNAITQLEMKLSRNFWCC
jgi:hypothetical protein